MAVSKPTDFAKAEGDALMVVVEFERHFACVGHQPRRWAGESTPDSAFHGAESLVERHAGVGCSRR